MAQIVNRLIFKDNFQLKTFPGNKREQHVALSGNQTDAAPGTGGVNTSSNRIFPILCGKLPVFIVQKKCCVINNTNIEGSWAEQLTEELRNKLSWYPCCSDNRIVDVGIRFIFRDIHFDNTEETLQIKSTAVYQYQDDELKWNPKEFDQIKTISIDSGRIWVPFATAFNRGDKSSHFVSCTPLFATSTGNVVFTVTYLEVINCIAELTN
ncbi:hypothetical protein K1T71_013353 [Dendrolimus kikuchii]|uniref:Uncharacterized protein n=1 Tax=Dendrolimus kikuchii TaxID=765133 RepID=A0ACC1CHU8_9NEOP|nr:hypothetical protein K1T71_013353 [Dendrolimus kikuchii]